MAARESFVLVSLAGLLAAGFPAPAAADPQDIRAVELSDLLDHPIRVVSLGEQRLSETPAAAVVLTAEDISAFGFRTLAEALASVPGVFAYRDDFFPAVGVRGLGPLMDYGTRLLVMVDGHPLNDSLGLGGSLVGRDFPVPIGAVKRIEVVKGPVGSLYGPSAFFGVVNVITADPDDRASSVRGAGEAGGGAPAGDVGFVLTTSAGELGVTAAAELRGARGARLTLPELLVPVEGRETPAGPAVRGRSGSGSAYLRLGWRALSLAGACAESAFQPVTAAYASNVGDPHTRMSSRHCFLGLGWHHAMGEQLALDLHVSYDDHLFRDVFAYAPPPESIGLARDLARDRWATGDARLTWRPGETTRVIAGITTQLHDTLQRVYADGLSTTVEDPVNGYGPGDITKGFGSVNGYALLEQHLGPALVLDLGATLYWHALYGGRVTPKAALVWSPSEADRVKLIWSQGFRAPTMSEAFYDDGLAYLANPDLAPEAVDAAEVRFQHRLGSTVTLEASGFVHHYRRLIRFQTVPAPGVIDPVEPSDFRQQGLNEGDLWLRGGELSASMAWGRWLRGYGGLAVQDVGRRLVNFPAVTASVALSTRAPWEPLSLAVTATAMAARAKDPGNAGEGDPRVRPSLTVNAHALLEVPGTRGLSVELSASNLLGTAGPEPLLADNAPVSELPAPPRTWRLGLTYRFE